MVHVLVRPSQQRLADLAASLLSELRGRLMASRVVQHVRIDRRTEFLIVTLFVQATSVESAEEAALNECRLAITADKRMAAWRVGPCMPGFPDSFHEEDDGEASAGGLQPWRNADNRNSSDEA